SNMDRLKSTRSQSTSSRLFISLRELFPAPHPTSKILRIRLVVFKAAWVINSISKAASTTEVWPVSRPVKRSTSLSNRFRISSKDDFCSSVVLLLIGSFLHHER